MKKIILLFLLLMTMTSTVPAQTSSVICVGEPDGNPYVWSNCVPGIEFPNSSVTIDPFFKAVVSIPSSLDVTEIYNSSGNLKIQPDVQGDIDFFGDTDVDDAANGKTVNFWRMAAEGDTRFAFYIENNKTAHVESVGTTGGFIYTNQNGSIDINHTAEGDVHLFQYAGSGENRYFKLTGYITAASGGKDILMRVSDTTDNFEITREDVNILGMDVQMPFITDDLTASGVIKAGSGAVQITDATGNLDGTKVADADLGDISTSLGTWTVDSASATVAGKIEIATAAETTTGTDATRAVSPDGLAGSDYGKRFVTLALNAPTDSVTTGDGKAHWFVPAELNGWNLVAVSAGVVTASSSGTPSYAVYNVTDAADMLSVNVTIDANEKHSSSAVTPPTINGATDDIATGDELRIDCDVAGTGTKGDQVTLVFQLP